MGVCLSVILAAVKSNKVFNTVSFVLCSRHAEGYDNHRCRVKCLDGNHDNKCNLFLRHCLGMATRLITFELDAVQDSYISDSGSLRTRRRTSGFGAMFTNEDAVEHCLPNAGAKKCFTGALLPKYGRVSWLLGPAPGNFTAPDQLVNV